MDKPLNSDDLVDRGEEHHKAGRVQEAEMCYRQALAIDAGHPGALYFLAAIACEDGRLEFAKQLVDTLLRDEPNDAEAWHLSGLIALKQKDLTRAGEFFQKALAIQPAYAQAHYSLANTLHRQGNNAGAAVAFARVIALEPNAAAAHINLGNVLKNLQRVDEALTCYDKAIALEPGCIEAYLNRSLALKSLNRLDEALACYDKIIALKPDHAEAYNERGILLQDLKRLDEALISYDKAIALKPNFAEAHGNRGVALMLLKRLDEAANCYARAIELQPDCEFLLGTYLHTKMMACDWRNLDALLENCEAGIRSFKRVTAPFPSLALWDAPALHRRAAEIFADARSPRMEQLGAIGQRTKTEKIRIGYYSADFHNHATAYLMAELFEAHDASKFELFGFSFGPNVQDEMRKRISSRFDKFFDVGAKSDLDIARLSRELGIDIAVDLKGFTSGERSGIFAARCAPVQANYLGYPGTMAAEYIDYIIADKTVIPEESQADYAEKVVYLPHCYQVNDSKRKISPRVFTRQELGLPESGFVFCCFNNNYKILPATFDIWMRMLGAVEGSVLWLFEDNPMVVTNLRKEAELRGIQSERLVFARRLPLDEHLARHRMADLFIDTLPCNAHTTASDALWAGLPLLTCMGKSFASRVAASLLTTLELRELITDTPAEYEATAIELALNPAKLLEIKRKLEKNRLATPLFDAKLFAKHIESAYTAMYDRYQAGLAPATIEVKTNVSVI